MFNAFLTVILLSIVVMAMAAPDWTVLGISPATPVLIAASVFGLRTAKRLGEHPMWHPRQTTDTRGDQPDTDNDGFPLPALFARFGALSVTLG